jgi:hypothetical protein
VQLSAPQRALPERERPSFDTYLHMLPVPPAQNICPR